MKLHFTPTNEYQQFAEEVYNLLVENSADTFYVGGMVRNLILQKDINDIDIATALRPEQVAKILEDHRINMDTVGLQFGVINAIYDTNRLEITTFRTDTYTSSRYPEITYVDSAVADSARRDFTINALYLQGRNDIISDFHGGLKDLQGEVIRFIGDPLVRVTEDPIRIIRAYRLADELGFEIDEIAKQVCEKNVRLLENISENKLQKEFAKCQERTKKYLTNLLQKSID